jgi:hypothetical protein
VKKKWGENTCNYSTSISLGVQEDHEIFKIEKKKRPLQVRILSGDILDIKHQ